VEYLVVVKCKGKTIIKVTQTFNSSSETRAKNDKNMLLIRHIH